MPVGGCCARLGSRSAFGVCWVHPSPCAPLSLRTPSTHDMPCPQPRPFGGPAAARPPCSRPQATARPSGCSCPCTRGRAARVTSVYVCCVPDSGYVCCVRNLCVRVLRARRLCSRVPCCAINCDAPTALGACCGFHVYRYAWFCILNLVFASAITRVEFYNSFGSVWSLSVDGSSSARNTPNIVQRMVL